MLNLEDKKYRYVTYFDPKTGIGGRSNVIDFLGNETNIEPFMGSFPDLLDIGIMGHCEHGLSGLCALSGVQCYQEGSHKIENHLSLDQFKSIIDQAKGRCFQVALGGRGDPDMHPDIIEILNYAYRNNVTPNFTTSGYGLKDELLPAIKQYCGAVAVSWYRHEITRNTIKKLVDYGIKTNIHYVLSKSTIDEAFDRVKNNSFPNGINRIIFLIHKPVGDGMLDEVLTYDNPMVKQFFELFDNSEIANRSGFDSCGVPALHSFTKQLHPDCIEACEAGRFSAYISSSNKLIPCSFEKDEKYAISLNEMSIENAWNSKEFNDFRAKYKVLCSNCVKNKVCNACPIVPAISICNYINEKGKHV